jgi:H+/gluconate symporter-like permease
MNEKPRQPVDNQQRRRFLTTPFKRIVDVVQTGYAKTEKQRQTIARGANATVYSATRREVLAAGAITAVAAAASANVWIDHITQRIAAFNSSNESRDQLKKLTTQYNAATSEQKPEIQNQAEPVVQQYVAAQNKIDELDGESAPSLEGAVKYIGTIVLPAATLLAGMFAIGEFKNNFTKKLQTLRQKTS